ncbi:unnamed protein product [Caenorhabditis nigoni]
MSVHESEMALLQQFGQLNIQNKPKKHQLPLWKLPRVVLLDCVENLDYLEIILFSRLSKRAKTIAKLVRWNSLNICLKADSQPVIQLRCSIDPGRIWKIVYEKREESSGYPYFTSILTGPKVVYRLTLENAIENSKQMTEHICEVFRSPITGIEIADESFIEWLIKFQPTIRYVAIRKDVVTSVETLHRVLNNLNVTEYFHVKSIAIHEYFQYLEPIPLRSIAIKDSSWVTLPSILNGNNSIIRLYGSKWTEKEINTMLKEWQKGTKLRNLEFLEILISTPLDARCEPNICTLIDALIFIERAGKGLNITLSDENDRPLTIKIHDEFTFTPPRVIRTRNLIRSDGMMGSVFWQYKLHGQKNLVISYLDLALHYWCCNRDIGFHCGWSILCDGQTRNVKKTKANGKMRDSYLDNQPN